MSVLGSKIASFDTVTGTFTGGTITGTFPIKTFLLTPNTETETAPINQDPPLTQTETFSEKVQVIERIRNSVDLDPSAKSRILLLAASKPNLTSQDLRVIYATCLYPSAQGLPSPEGYEYFLTLIEKGSTVTAALADSRIYFKADAALTGNAGDPTAPDSQQQSRVLLVGIFIAAFLIISKL